MEAALGGKLEPEPIDKPGTLDKALVDRMIGTYQMTDDSKAKLAALGAPVLATDLIQRDHDASRCGSRREARRARS